MVGMLILSFLLAYPIFMLFAYLVANFLFPDRDKVVAAHKMEKFVLMQRARRIRRAERVKIAKRQQRAVTIHLSSEKLIHEV